MPGLEATTSPPCHRQGAQGQGLCFTSWLISRRFHGPLSVEPTTTRRRLGPAVWSGCWQGERALLQRAHGLS